MSRWEIDFTAAAEQRLLGLDDDEFDAIAPAIDELEARGPGLGRPCVDTVKGSRHRNMQELEGLVQAEHPDSGSIVR